MKIIPGGGGQYSPFKFIRAIYKLYRVYAKQRRYGWLYEEISSLIPHIRDDMYYMNFDPKTLIDDYGIKVATICYLGHIIIKNRESVSKGMFIKSIKFANKALNDILLSQQIRDMIIKYTGINCIDLSFLDTESLYIIQSRIKDIQNWITSDKYKEKYSNIPYPPLLDPDTFDYHKIPAKIAYALNMPLPNNYAFILLATNCSGHSAMIRTLRLCNINIADDHYSSSTLYEINYDICLKDGLNAVITTCYNKHEYRILYDKFFYLLHKKVPIINLVRDPIGRLRRILNAPHVNYFYSFPINLMAYSKYALDNRIVFRFSRDLPIRDRVSKAIDIFFFNRRDMRLYGFNEIFHIGMEDILPHKVFDTLQYLSKNIGFQIPLPREAYEKMYSAEYGKNLLPLSLVYKEIKMFIVAKSTFVNNENNLINLSFKEPLSDYIDITGYFNIDMPNFKQELIIIAHKDYLHDIQHIDSKDNVDSVFNELFKDMHTRIDIHEKRYMMTEQRLLHELKHDFVAYNIVKEACERELALVPNEIVNEFYYYKAFLDMQKDMYISIKKSNE